MEDTLTLIARAQAGEASVREQLVEKNLGLVHIIVRRFLGRGADAEDLFQIGTIGLIKAIDKFDTSLGLQFSTYAVPMITGEIKRYLRDDGPVKVSRLLKENYVKIKQAEQQLIQSLGRDPSVGELAAKTGLAAEDVVEALEAGAGVTSLYSSVGTDDGCELYLVDKIVQGAGSEHGVGLRFGGCPEDSEKEVFLNRMFIGQLLDTLDAREKELITLRYFENMTQTVIAERLGISQVQVSRLEKRILRRLRENADL